MQALRFQMWGFPVWQRPRLHSIWNQISTGVVSGRAFEMSLQRAREVFLNASTIRSSCAGWRGLALMWEKPIFFRSVPT